MPATKFSDLQKWQPVEHADGEEGRQRFWARHEEMNRVVQTSRDNRTPEPEFIPGDTKTGTIPAVDLLEENQRRLYATSGVEAPPNTYFPERSYGTTTPSEGRTDLDRQLEDLESLSDEDFESTYQTSRQNRDIYSQIVAANFESDAAAQKQREFDKEYVNEHKTRIQQQERYDKLGEAINMAQTFAGFPGSDIDPDFMESDVYKDMVKEHEELGEGLALDIQAPGLDGEPIRIQPGGEADAGLWDRIAAFVQPAIQNIADSRQADALGAWARLLPEVPIQIWARGNNVFQAIPAGLRAAGYEGGWKNMSGKDALGLNEFSIQTTAERDEATKQALAHNLLSAANWDGGGISLEERIMAFSLGWQIDYLTRLDRETESLQPILDNMSRVTGDGKHLLGPPEGKDKFEYGPNLTPALALIGTHPMEIDLSDPKYTDEALYSWGYDRAQLIKTQLWYKDAMPEKDRLMSESVAMYQQMMENRVDMYQQDPSGEMVRVQADKALELMEEAINLQNELALVDPRFTDNAYRYTWNMGPDAEVRKAAALRAIAIATIQNGGWLDKWQVRDITNRYVDPASEFIGENVFDPINLIPGVVFEYALLKPLKMAGKGVRWGAKLPSIFPGAIDDLISTIPKVESEFFARNASNFSSSLFETSVSSLGSAAKLEGDHIFGLIARGKTNTEDVRKAFQALINGNYSSKALEGVQVPLGTKLRLAGTKGLLNQLGMIGDPAEFMYKIFDSAVSNAQVAEENRLIAEALQSIVDFGPLSTKNVDEAVVAWKVERKAAGKAGQEFLTEHPFIPRADMRAIENQALRHSEEFSNVLPKLGDKIKTEFVAMRSQWKDGPIHGTAGSGFVDLFKKLDAKTKGKIPKALYAEDSTLLRDYKRFTNWARGAWSGLILSARPGFTIINYIDSGLRMVLSGGSVFSDIPSLVKRVPYTPGEVPGGFMATIDRFGYNISERIAEGWWPKNGFLDIFADAAGSGKGYYDKWTKGWSGVNSALETSFRLRLYVPEFEKNFDVIEKMIKSVMGNEGLLDNMDPHTVALFRELQVMSGNNPSRMLELAKQFTEFKASKGSPFGLFLDDAWYDDLVKTLGPNRARYLGSEVMNDMLKLMQADKLDEININLLFNKLDEAVDASKADRINNLNRERAIHKTRGTGPPIPTDADAAKAGYPISPAKDTDELLETQLKAQKRSDATEAIARREVEMAEIDGNIEKAEKKIEGLKKKIKKLDTDQPPLDARGYKGWNVVDDAQLDATTVHYEHFMLTDEEGRTMTVREAIDELDEANTVGSSALMGEDGAQDQALAYEELKQIRDALKKAGFAEEAIDTSGDFARAQEQLAQAEKHLTKLVADKKAFESSGWEDLKVQAAIDETPVPVTVEKVEDATPVTDLAGDEELAEQIVKNSEQRRDGRSILRSDLRDSHDELAQIAGDKNRILIDNLGQIGDDIQSANQALQVASKAEDAVKMTEASQAIAELTQIQNYIMETTKNIGKHGEGGYKLHFLRTVYPNPNARYAGAPEWALYNEILNDYYSRVADHLDELNRLLTGTADDRAVLLSMANNPSEGFPTLNELVGAQRAADGSMVAKEGEEVIEGMEFLFDDDGNLRGVRHTFDDQTPRIYDPNASFDDRFDDFWGGGGHHAIADDFEQTMFGRGLGNEAEEMILNEPHRPYGKAVQEDAVELTADEARDVAKAEREQVKIQREVVLERNEDWDVLREQMVDDVFIPIEGSYDDYMANLDGLINAAYENGQAAEVSHLMRYKGYVEDRMKILQSARPGATPVYTMPSINRWAPESATAMMNIQMLSHESELVKTSMATLRAKVLNGMKSGDVFTTKLGAEQAAQLKRISNRYADLMGEGIETANYGGKFMGRDFRGAVNFTNERMLDYTSFNNVEGFIKSSVIPFYMFPARSLPMWISLMAARPQIALFYSKYLETSTRQAYQHGLVDRRGNPLPRTRGRLPVPGTNMWVNFTAPMSFRYALPQYWQMPRYEGSEELNATQMVGKYLYEMGRTFGVTSYPFITEMFFLSGAITPDDAPRWSLFPQVDLMPPNWKRVIDEALRKDTYGDFIGGLTNYAADILIPEVGWKDFLIENEVLKWAVDEIGLGEDSNRVVLLAEAAVKYKGRDITSNIEELESERDRIIAEREKQGDPEFAKDTYLFVTQQLEVLGDKDNPESRALWFAMRDSLENSEHGQRVGGYFTSVYGTQFTDADAELILWRNENDMLKGALNNELTSAVFNLDPRIQERNDHYINRRYVMPEGVITGLRSTIGWVEMPDGTVARGEDRTLELARVIQEDQQTRAYHEALKFFSVERERKLTDLEIGATSKQQFAVQEEYWDNLANLETADMYNEAHKGWFVGYTPKSLVWENLRGYFWREVKKGAPAWDPNKYTAYADYEKDYKEYMERIPEIVAYSEVLWNEFAAIEWLDASVNKPDDVMAQLLEEASYEGFLEWEKDNVSLTEAVQIVYRDNFEAGFYLATDNMSNEERRMAGEDYLKQFGSGLKPSNMQIAQWVVQTFGDRFAYDDVMEELQGREVSDLDYRQMQQNIEKVGQEKAYLDKRKWDAVNAIPPGYARGDFEQAFKDNGGDERFLVEMWESHSTLDDMGYYNTQMGIMEKTITELGFSFDPPRSELEDRAEARVDEKAKPRWINENTYPGFAEELALYWKMDDDERSGYRRANPDFAAAYKKYWPLLEEYAKTHPEWALYYYKDGADNTRGITGIGSGYSSGGSWGSYSGGYQAPTGVGSSPGGPSNQPWVPQGKRASQDVRRLAFTQGTGGIVGNIVWPRSVTTYTGTELPKRVNSALKAGEPIDALDSAFMDKVSNNHPETKPFLDEVSRGFAYQGLSAEHSI